jgi:glutamine cyclotransferase
LSPPPPVARAEVVRRHPHDADAFTQGLFHARGLLYESSGLFGRSEVRQVEPESGKVIRSAKLPPDMFAEGIAPWGETMIGVTWRNGAGFRWRLDDLSPIDAFGYEGEAWGLATDGESLILSDGSPSLRFLDPGTFAERRRIAVTQGGRPIAGLNALQWVEGGIFANILGWPAIARIDPGSGSVTSWIDLSALVAEAGGGDREKIANGIAWDSASGRLFVTGKNWPWLYEIALPPG